MEAAEEATEVRAQAGGAGGEGKGVGGRHFHTSRGRKENNPGGLFMQRHNYLLLLICHLLGTIARTPS